ncbi:MAG: hypothetical protein QXK18_08085 [Candidatus Bathyarchaeia archaeon]
MNELSAMLVGWVSGLLLGMWLYPRLLAFLNWLERRLSGGCL